MVEIICIAFVYWTLPLLYDGGYAALLPIIGVPIAVGWFCLSLMQRFRKSGKSADENFRITPGEPTPMTHWEDEQKYVSKSKPTPPPPEKYDPNSFDDIDLIDEDEISNSSNATHKQH